MTIFNYCGIKLKHHCNTQVGFVVTSRLIGFPYIYEKNETLEINEKKDKENYTNRRHSLHI